MSDVITATERRELRSAVRAEARAARGVIKQRGQALEAEVEARLIEKYRDDDKKIQQLEEKLRKVTEKANAEVQKAVAAFQDANPGVYLGRVYSFNPPLIYRDKSRKENLRRALMAGMQAELGRASSAVNQQEADLLKALALDALRSDRALSFMERIKTVHELLPAGKMAEIEAKYEEGH